MIYIHVILSDRFWGAKNLLYIDGDTSHLLSVTWSKK